MTRLLQIPSSAELNQPFLWATGWFSWWWNLREARLYMTRLSQIPSSAESAFALSNRVIQLMMESARAWLYMTRASLQIPSSAELNQPLPWATGWSAPVL
jgi:hypothetical protein